MLTNPGGALGWAVRHITPVLATRLYLYYIRLTRASAVRRRITDFMAAKTAWFTHVEVETINRCNGKCSFCPVNRLVDPRPYRLMSESLFERIIGQLSDMRYSGYLGLFSNNEPLLDKRLETFAAGARRALPGAFINLSTNGRLLDREMFTRLARHFDRMVVNNYRDVPELHDNIRSLVEFCQADEGRALLAGKTLEICLRNDADVLTSRGGTAPNRPAPARPLAIPCSLPFTQLVIRPDGGVSLCCNDALGQMTLGDLERQSLSDVWFGPACAEARRLMFEKGRRGIAMCRICDFVKHDAG